VNVQDRLNELLKKKGLTRYKLAKQSGVPEETLTNIFTRGSVPTISTLELICKGLNITLAQFFAENDMIEYTPELKKLYDEWSFLTPKQKDLIFELIKEMNNKK
jgi:transcriptional regulator, XRE family